MGFQICKRLLPNRALIPSKWRTYSDVYSIDEVFVASDLQLRIPGMVAMLLSMIRQVALFLIYDLPWRRLPCVRWLGESGGGLVERATKPIPPIY